MDIRAGAAYPQGQLSNFPPHPFVLDGVEIASMEGFLQALKVKAVTRQGDLCRMIGMAARNAGMAAKWRKSQILYWQGRPMARSSVEYQDLLDRAYEALVVQNAAFRTALAATGDAVLTHAVGRKDPTETVITEREFIGRLTRLRERLHRGEIPL
jgi:predicted NAD-dependent protein-ADP-ribosyltransferase YbiA (DUF1768 family)